MIAGGGEDDDDVQFAVKLPLVNYAIDSVDASSPRNFVVVVGFGGDVDGWMDGGGSSTTTLLFRLVIFDELIY